MNIENLSIRLSNEETDAVIAVPDMAFGNIYQHQGNLQFYTVNKFTGDALVLDRVNSKWLKQVGLSFKFMMSTKWKRVEDEKEA